MAKKYINLSDRTERLLDNLKCRTDAETNDEVIRKALMVYNLVGTGLEQGHKVMIGAEPINLMEFHVLPTEPAHVSVPKLAVAEGD